MLTLGLEIKLHRTRAGITQRAFARLIGTAATTHLVRLWENGIVQPGDKYIAKIRAFLNIDPAALKWCAENMGLMPPRKNKRQIKLRRP